MTESVRNFGRRLLFAVLFMAVLIGGATVTPAQADPRIADFKSKLHAG